MAWQHTPRPLLAPAPPGPLTQAVAPSPFYFFDEIDCALDTLAASRVANYLLTATATSALTSVTPTTHSADAPAAAALGHAADTTLGSGDAGERGPALGNGMSRKAPHAVGGVSGVGAGAGAGIGAGQGGRLPAPLGAQYLVVSHKPQVFEAAHTLVGVYGLCGTSAVAVARGLGAGVGGGAAGRA